MLFRTGSCFITVFLLLFLSACGGEVVFLGDANNSSEDQTEHNSSIDANQTIKAYFIDEAVEGLEYNTTSRSGITDELGTFYFLSTDKTITFKVGHIKIADFELKNLAKDDRILPIDLIENNTSIIRSSRVNNDILKIILTLQSLDSDLNSSNGIKITESERKLFSENIDILDENLSISELNSTFINAKKELISSSRAIKHYLESVNAINELNSDTTPPKFKNASSVTMQENQLEITKIIIEDQSNVTLKLDSDLLEWVPNTTKIKFKVAPDFEKQSSYSFRIYATDAFNNQSFQDLVVNIENIDDTPPLFTSATSVSVAEGRKPVIELQATDSDSSTIRFELDKNSSDIFSIDGSIVSFKNAPDYETKNSYLLYVKAIDESGNIASETINVAILDIDEVAPVFVSEGNVSVPENQLDVMNLQVQDSSDVTYNIEGKDASAFILNGAKITFKNAPDFEAGRSYDFNIRATDSYSNSSKKAFHVTILDVDENKPIITNEANISINENSSYVMKIVATDESALTYSVSGTDASYFVCDNLTGDVSLKAAADYEAKDQYKFTIVATDSVHNAASKAIILNIKDLDDTGPIFSSSNSVSVEENSSFIMKVKASDIAGVSYSLVTSDDSKTVQIDPESGNLSFKVLADYESKSLYHINVIATDGLANKSSQLITIHIINIDDTPPLYTGNTTLSFEENKISSFYLQASDPDNIGALSYTLSGSDAVNFDINSSSGKVTFKERPDFEIKPCYKLSVSISDEAGHTTTQALTINIVDIDEIAPIFTSKSVFKVDEGQRAVTTITTRDVSEVKYYISGGRDANSFSISEKEGVLTFKKAPDYEKRKSYEVSVEAIDTQHNSETQDIHIDINNLNDTPPLLTNESNVSVDENQLNLMTLVGSDADNLQALSYSISGVDAHYLNIDRNSGIVTFKTAPDFESKSKYNFTTSVSDGKNSSSKDINVTIHDVNEYAPIFTSSSSVAVDENQISVMTLHAIDKDPTDTVLFAIEGVDSADFNLSNGVITFKEKPDYETKSNYSIRAIASDGVRESSQTINIKINNINDNAPRFYATSASVNENQYEAMTLGVSDADNLDPSEITISGQDAAAFDFDGSVLRFKQRPNYEAKKEYKLNATADDGKYRTTQTITINISDIPETKLYIKKALYQNNNTATVNDDKLYIYFNKEIDQGSIPADMSSAYNIYGVGSIGSDSTSEYNDTLFHQQIISLNSLGSASEAFVAGESNISLSYHTITDANNSSYPEDENITTIETWTHRTLLQTDQNVSYIDYDDYYYKKGKTKAYSEIVEGSERAVEENSTKLVWQKEDDDIARDWDSAVSYCENLTYIGKSNWRLPNIEELMFLTNKSKNNPSINSNYFTNTKSSKYWSATTLVGDDNYAWIVDFSDGDDSWLNKKDYQLYVRCVRDKE